jgi:hypothetical protein
MAPHPGARSQEWFCPLGGCGKAASADQTRRCLAAVAGATFFGDLIKKASLRHSPSRDCVGATGTIVAFADARLPAIAGFDRDDVALDRVNGDRFMP